MRLTPDAALTLVRETLVRSNTSDTNAGHVADALVAAELVGQSGHGLRRVPSYAGQALSGKVDGHANPTLGRTRPGVISIDAANGFAYPAIALAEEALPPIVRDQGVAVAGIRRSHHAGVTGLVVERLAEQGLVALMLVNSPPAMAPWGGTTALLGTNPVAFAVPTASEPIVIDLSLSEVARGKVMAAKQKGEPIPEGWAFDSEGNPTTDPDAALSGTMAPAGGAKGAVLALMVELLAAGLTGANYASDASSFFETGGTPPGTGQFLLSIDPDAVAVGGVERFTALADAIEADPGARLPGRRRRELAAERAGGFEVDDDLLRTIDQLGR
jgi:(2R)-3-sulfolactate dehydrogenase (NADP+)